MKRWLAAAFAASLIAATLLSGCCACRSYQRRTQKPLEGTLWQLVQWEGRTVAAEGDGFTVVFSADGRISGRGSCNRIMGSYKADAKGALEISKLGATRMACPDPARENAFIEMLEGTTHYEMDGPMLLLLRDGELHAVMQAKPDLASAKTGE